MFIFVLNEYGSITVEKFVALKDAHIEFEKHSKSYFDDEIKDGSVEAFILDLNTMKKEVVMSEVRKITVDGEDSDSWPECPTCGSPVHPDNYEDMKKEGVIK